MNTLTKSDNQTMSSREIANLTSKRHPDVKRDCEVMFKELDLDVSKFAHIYLDAMNRKQSEYLLPRDLVETLITGYNIKLRHAVLIRLRELEEIVKQNTIELPNFSNPAEAARAWAIEYEGKQIAEQERDHAIETKAHISDKKTATAMATASAKSRQAEALKEQLGESKKYASVKAVENKTGGKYNWRNLKKWCLEKGREIKDIADPNFGTVKIYPKEAWEEVYGIKLKSIFG